MSSLARRLTIIKFNFQNMNKRTKQIISAGLTISSLAIAPIAFAESNPTTETAKLPKFVKQLTVSAVNGKTLTATDKEGKSYTVDISGADQKRKIKGINTENEISVTDKIIVKGQEDGATIKALSVRDMSIHQKLGKTSGKVSNIGATSFTLTTPKGITLTINTTANTKYNGNKNHPLTSLAELKDGDQVMVNGLKDNTTNTETANVIHLFTNDPNLKKDDLQKPRLGINKGEHKGLKLGKNSREGTTPTNTVQQ